MGNAHGFDIKINEVAETAENIVENAGTKFDGAFELAEIGCLPGVENHRIDRPIEEVQLDDAAKSILHDAVDSLFPMHNLKDIFDQLREGVELPDGTKSLSLEALAKRKINPQFRTQIIKQRSGFAAELISTARENIEAMQKGIEIKTIRADDLPGLFSINDPYVDKVRINSAGEIVERIQTKFFGKNGDEWISKMMSKKNEKYLFDNKVDKLECPKDFYDDAKRAIVERREKLSSQLDRVVADGKNDVAEKIRAKLEKLGKIDEMLEQSSITTSEAEYAVKHPRRFVTREFGKEVVKQGHSEGLDSGMAAAGITFIVSSVDNVTSFVNGEITAEEMAADVAKETAAAGLLGYGTEFVSVAISQTMQHSSTQLISSIGKTCLPAAAVSFAVESYSSISDFACGVIDEKQLAYDLGKNAVNIGAGIEGAAIGAKAGAMIGTLAGPAGTAVGGVAGSLVGGVVGCALASEVYATAVEYGAENIDAIADRAEQFAQSTVDAAAELVPEKVGTVRAALNTFASTNNLPFQV